MVRWTLSGGSELSDPPGGSELSDPPIVQSPALPTGHWRCPPAALALALALTLRQCGASAVDPVTVYGKALFGASARGKVSRRPQRNLLLQPLLAPHHGAFTLHYLDECQDLSTQLSGKPTHVVRAVLVAELQPHPHQLFSLARCVVNRVHHHGQSRRGGGQETKARAAAPGGGCGDVGTTGRPNARGFT